MSRANVETVRSMLEPFDGVDIAQIDWRSEAIRETLEGFFSPDVVLRTLESGVGIGPSREYHGLDGLVRYLDEWFEPFSEYRWDLLDFIEAGDSVLVPIRARGIGSISGAEVELELTVAYLFEDRKVTRVDQYDTLEEARASSRSSG